MCGWVGATRLHHTTYSAPAQRSAAQPKHDPDSETLHIITHTRQTRDQHVTNTFRTESTYLRRAVSKQPGYSGNSSRTTFVTPLWG